MKSKEVKIRISQESRPGRPPRWLAVVYRSGLSGPMDGEGGRRERRRFDTKAGAEVWAESRRAFHAKVGVEVAALDRNELNDTIRALDMLEGASLADAMKELKMIHDRLGNGRVLLDALDEIQAARTLLEGRASLAEAAAYWKAHNPAGGATLAQVAARYMADRAGNRPSYYRNVKSKCKIFLDALGADRLAASVVVADLRAFMDGRGTASATRRGWRTFLLDFFKTGVDDFALDGNPATGLKVVKNVEAPDDADIYTPEEAERILRAAEAEGPLAAVATALLLFAGLRPNELTGGYKVRPEVGVVEVGEVVGGLRWTDIKKDDVVVRRSTSKTKSYRRVPLRPCLRAWLDRYVPEGRDPRANVIPNPQWWRRTRDRIAERAGVRWLQDGTRHSFASYAYALDGDRAAVEAALGHSGGTNTFERFYEAEVEKEEAEAYFSIRPGTTKETSP